MIKKTGIVYDKGLYTFLAQKLGEEFEKVYYYIPSAEPYPKSPKREIGKGLPEIERVYSFWDHVDKCDLVVFFDCYEGDFQDWLREKGYRVFGAGKAEKLELDKVFFLEYLEKVGLDVPRTFRAEGLEELTSYLKGKGQKWLKTSYTRGDFETERFDGMHHLKSFLDDLRYRIGTRAEDIEVLVQDPIKSEAEVGYDGFCVDGAFTDHCMTGYEVKDKGLVAKISETTPKILADVNQKVSPYMKRYRGHWSTEIRISPSGRAYFIDPTCRAPSPPSELMCEMYKNYPEIVWKIAGGEMPEIQPAAQYGAEIILTSSWHEQHEICVEFPPDLKPYVKLKNVKKEGGHYYCVPNENGAFFGAVIATGKTMEAATKLCLERAEQIKAKWMEIDHAVFQTAAEAVKAGEKFGVKW